MAGTGQGYDLAVTTYSPDGRIYQIDYAQKCVDTAATCIGVQCKDGIVFAVEKLKLSRMLVKGTNRRSYAITKHSGCCFTGLTPDGRDVVGEARGDALSYEQNYGVKIPGYILAERVGLYFHKHTLYYSLRPIGIGIVIGSCNSGKEPELYAVDPSGLVQKWSGRAFGKGNQLANTEIEKLNTPAMTCKEVLPALAKIIHKVHDENKDFELEMQWITAENKFVHSSVPEKLVAEAEEKAKKALEEEDDS